MSTNQAGSAAIVPKEFVVPGTAPATGILYLLYYRQGSNPHPQLLSFYHSSTDMQIIMERAKRHCDLMNYRFVFVKPFIVDLDREERKLNRDI